MLRAKKSKEAIKTDTANSRFPFEVNQMGQLSCAWPAAYLFIPITVMVATETKTLRVTGLERHELETLPPILRVRGSADESELENWRYRINRLDLFYYRPNL